MSSTYKQVLKFLGFLLVTVFLFWLVYRDQDPEELLKVLREDVNYTWVWIAIICGLLSHASRTLRWQLILRPMGYNISFANGFMGVMIGYFANLAIPRMGEFTRCGVVSKYENVPFSKLLGTVVTERVIDLIMLLLLTVLVIITQFKQVGIFLNDNEDIKSKLQSLFASPWTWIVIGVLVIGLIFFIYIWKKKKLSSKFKFVEGLKEGLMSFKSVENKWLFIFHSVFIWFMYYLMLYLCFFCFDFTSHLGPLVGLTVFVISSYGMVAPVQGGTGAWHFMVIASLLIYLPHTPQIQSLCKTFALLTHGTMMLLYIVVGVICLLVLPVYNRKR